MKKENNNNSNYKFRKIVRIAVISILVVTITPIAIIFLSFFMAGLANNDFYSSKDGSTQLLEPGCPAFTKNDGSDFNWSKIKSNQMLENCMFELAYKLGTPEKMANWLYLEGFESVSLASNTPSNEILLENISTRNSSLSNSNRELVFANWYPENQATPRPYKSYYNKLYDSIFTFPYTVGISYTDTNVEESIVSLRTK